MSFKKARERTIVPLKLREDHAFPYSWQGCSGLAFAVLTPLDIQGGKVRPAPPAEQPMGEE